MRSMDDKRGSSLPLSITDKCCGRIGSSGPTLADNISIDRRRWLRGSSSGLSSYLKWYKLEKWLK